MVFQDATKLQSKIKKLLDRAARNANAEAGVMLQALFNRVEIVITQLKNRNDCIFLIYKFKFAEDTWELYMYFRAGNFKSRKETIDARNCGVTTNNDYEEFKRCGFNSNDHWNDYQYYLNGNFTSKSEMMKARRGGFTTRAIYISYTNLGFQNYNEIDDYNVCVNGNYTSKSEMMQARRGGFTTRGEYVVACIAAANNLYEKYKEEFLFGTPIVCACDKGRLDDVKLLITGHDVNGSNGNNMTLKEYVNQEGRNSSGGEWTPLMAAAWYEHFQIVKYLIEQGEADPNIARSSGGCNALHIAASNNKKDTELIEFLLTNMSLNSINKNGYRDATPLDEAYNNDKSPIQQKIIDLLRSKGGKRGEEL